MKFALVLSILLGAFSSQAEVGFKNGNERTAVLSLGNIYVHCHASGGGPSSGAFRCSEEILLSGEYDYFVGPSGVAGDEVILTARHEDGSQRTKTVDYDSGKGQSKKQINLWIATLLQRPLLDPGKNTVSFKISKNGKTTASGEFIANVKDGGRKTCSHSATYWSNNSRDCQNGGSFCQRYFRENNYCL
ncbi:hypothetical protein [Bdellovibrio bacteriovorus]|uniref:hypothetical protein n=1 Tax=Bdellovibrio bacteriovorus TaxID=959 RepID=UPI000A9BD168|nr:hypothetical protein [Bdellovibrio bacteriovorus]